MFQERNGDLLVKNTKIIGIRIDVSEEFSAETSVYVSTLKWGHHEDD